MHFLKRFLGCIGVLMANSGLDLLRIAKMLTGKKYPQNVWALGMATEDVLREVITDIEDEDDLMNVLDNKASQSKTAKFWVDGIIVPTFLIMIHIRAEREADWPLHLWAVKEMLSYFFLQFIHIMHGTGCTSSGPWKSFLQNVWERCLKGEHVMRHSPGIGIGIWSDMFIDTTFMRCGHDRGGIVGITLNPHAVK